MTNRLRLWKGGLAPGTEGETIMAPIARALSDRQIDDRCRRYYASVAHRAAMTPHPASPCCAPHGPQAGQIATLAWVLFALGAVSCLRS